MRGAIAAVLLAVGGAQIAFAESDISVGGTRMAIPDPEGFTLLTSEMQPFYQLRQTYVVPTNVNFAVYLPDEAAASATAGQIPQFERHLAIETSVMTVSLDVTPEVFNEIRTASRTQNDEIVAQVMRELPEFFDGADDRLSDALGAEVAISASSYIPLKAHEDKAKAYAFSAYMNIDVVAADGTQMKLPVTQTTTVLHVRDRVIFIYVTGAGDDLEWTREFSQGWAAAILAAND